MSGVLHSASGAAVRLPAARRPPAALTAASNGIASRAQRRHALAVAQLAVASLHAELRLYPKPGLVSPVDTGSHDDMDASTFMRSLFALRHYFRRICLAGMRNAPFVQLKQLGIAAEAAMLKATHGINTHRGAIFSLGLLCAAAGRMYARAHDGAAGGAPGSSRQRARNGPAALRLALLEGWGAELALHAYAGAAAGASSEASSDASAEANAEANNRVSTGASAAGPTDSTHANRASAANRISASASNGQRVAQRYAVGGAREEGALGLPSVFEVALPALHAARLRGATAEMAQTDALFALMAHVSDSNVYHRAGIEGAQTVREHARRFLDLGGTRHPQWRATALASHRAFVVQRLSPGGAADLLAATCFVDAIANMDGAVTPNSAAASMEYLR